jgi:hypothetical protein
MLHCVLQPGQTVYIPCNWYHATLNIGETLAAGGQQAEGSDATGGETCAEDTDATANAQFQQATQAITQAIASQEEDERARMFATGEVLLQESLKVVPYRLESWLWRLHIHGARGDVKAATALVNEAAGQFEEGLKDGVLSPLRATVNLVAVIRQLLNDKLRVSTCMQPPPPLHPHSRDASGSLCVPLCPSLSVSLCVSSGLTICMPRVASHRACMAIAGPGNARALAACPRPRL